MASRDLIGISLPGENLPALIGLSSITNLINSGPISPKLVIVASLAGAPNPITNLLSFLYLISLSRKDLTFRFIFSKKFSFIKFLKKRLSFFAFPIPIC